MVKQDLTSTSPMIFYSNADNNIDENGKKRAVIFFGD